MIPAEVSHAKNVITVADVKQFAGIEICNKLQISLPRTVQYLILYNSGLSDLIIISSHWLMKTWL